MDLSKYILMEDSYDDQRFGAVTIYYNPEDPQDIIGLKTRVFTSQDEFYEKLQMAEERLRFNNPYILKMLFVQPEAESLSIRICFEYPNEDLVARAPELKSPAEVLKMLHDVLCASAFLEKHKMVHGNIRPEYIYYNARDNNYLLLDRLGDYLTPVEAQNENLLGGLYLYMDPLVFGRLCKQDLQFVYNPFKVDTFALGMVVLSMVLYEGSDEEDEQPFLPVQELYNRESGSFNEEQFLVLLEEIKARYFVGADNELIFDFLSSCLLNLNAKARLGPYKAFKILKETLWRITTSAYSSMTTLSRPNESVSNAESFNEKGELKVLVRTKTMNSESELSKSENRVSGADSMMKMSLKASDQDPAENLGVPHPAKNWQSDTNMKEKAPSIGDSKMNFTQPIQAQLISDKDLKQDSKRDTKKQSLGDSPEAENLNFQKKQSFEAMKIYPNPENQNDFFGQQKTSKVSQEQNTFFDQNNIPVSNSKNNFFTSEQFIPGETPRGDFFVQQAPNHDLPRAQTQPLNSFRQTEANEFSARQYSIQDNNIFTKQTNEEVFAQTGQDQSQFGRIPSNIFPSSQIAFEQATLLHDSNHFQEFKSSIKPASISNTDKQGNNAESELARSQPNQNFSHTSIKSNEAPQLEFSQNAIQNESNRQTHLESEFFDQNHQKISLDQNFKKESIHLQERISDAQNHPQKESSQSKISEGSQHSLRNHRAFYEIGSDGNYHFREKQEAENQAITDIDGKQLAFEEIVDINGQKISSSNRNVKTDSQRNFYPFNSQDNTLNEIETQRNFSKQASLPHNPEYLDSPNQNFFNMQSLKSFGQRPNDAEEAHSSPEKQQYDSRISESQSLANDARNFQQRSADANFNSGEFAENSENQGSGIQRPTITVKYVVPYYDKDFMEENPNIQFVEVQNPVSAREVPKEPSEQHSNSFIQLQSLSQNQNSSLNSNGKIIIEEKISEMPIEEKKSIAVAVKSINTENKKGDNHNNSVKEEAMTPQKLAKRNFNKLFENALYNSVSLPENKLEAKMQNESDVNLQNKKQEIDRIKAESLSESIKNKAQAKSESINKRDASNERVMTPDKLAKRNFNKVIENLLFDKVSFSQKLPNSFDQKEAAHNIELTKIENKEQNDNSHNEAKHHSDSVEQKQKNSTKSKDKLSRKGDVSPEKLAKRNFNKLFGCVLSDSVIISETTSINNPKLSQKSIKKPSVDEKPPRYFVAENDSMISSIKQESMHNKLADKAKKGGLTPDKLAKRNFNKVFGGILYDSVAVPVAEESSSGQQSKTKQSSDKETLLNEISMLEQAKSRPFAQSLAAESTEKETASEVKKHNSMPEKFKKHESRKITSGLYFAPLGDIVEDSEREAEIDYKYSNSQRPMTSRPFETDTVYSNQRPIVLSSVSNQKFANYSEVRGNKRVISQHSFTQNFAETSIRLPELSELNNFRSQSHSEVRFVSASYGNSNQVKTENVSKAPLINPPPKFIKLNPEVFQEARRMSAALSGKQKEQREMKQGPEESKPSLYKKGSSRFLGNQENYTSVKSVANEPILNFKKSSVSQNQIASNVIYVSNHYMTLNNKNLNAVQQISPIIYQSQSTKKSSMPKIVFSENKGQSEFPKPKINLLQGQQDQYFTQQRQLKSSVFPEKTISKTPEISSRSPYQEIKVRVNPNFGQLSPTVPREIEKSNPSAPQMAQQNLPKTKDGRIIINKSDYLTEKPGQNNSPFNSNLPESKNTALLTSENKIKTSFAPIYLVPTGKFDKQGKMIYEQKDTDQTKVQANFAAPPPKYIPLSKNKAFEGSQPIPYNSGNSNGAKISVQKISNEIPEKFTETKKVSSSVLALPMKTNQQTKAFFSYNKQGDPNSQFQSNSNSNDSLNRNSIEGVTFSRDRSPIRVVESKNPVPLLYGNLNTQTRNSKNLSPVPLQKNYSSVNAQQIQLNQKNTQYDFLKKNDQPNKFQNFVFAPMTSQNQGIGLNAQTLENVHTNQTLILQHEGDRRIVQSQGQSKLPSLTNIAQRTALPIVEHKVFSKVEYLQSPQPNFGQVSFSGHNTQNESRSKTPVRQSQGQIKLLDPSAKFYGSTNAPKEALFGIKPS